MSQEPPPDLPGTASSETSDSIERFWEDWRAARKTSGVTAESVALRSGISKTVLYELGKPGKKRFPDDRQVETLLTLIDLPDAERATWLARYDRLRTADSSPNAADPAWPPQRSGPSWTTLWLAVASAVVLGVALGVGTAAWWPAAPASAREVPYAAIRAQNMVALGESDLRPDTTPAYLSARRVARCGAKNCKVADTDVDTGALLVATCQAQGEELVNYNLDSTSSDNPHRARSALWYGVQLPDGRTGFINQVYVDPRDRDGLGLPTCS